MTSSQPTSDTSDERYRIIHAGFNNDAITARTGLTHSDPAIRMSALRALARIQLLNDDDIKEALNDNDYAVRKCAVELSVSHPLVDITAMLSDSDVFVAEMAAWVLGERTSPTDQEISTLIHAVYSHQEALVREAAAAALGSIGDERGLPAILHACNDKPAVRRRAVLALAPFEGDEVTATLENAMKDRDWQVRQNAEDLLHPRGY